MDNRKKKNDLPPQPVNDDGKSNYPKSENNPTHKTSTSSEKYNKKYIFFKEEDDPKLEEWTTGKTNALSSQPANGDGNSIHTVCWL